MKRKHRWKLLLGAAIIVLAALVLMMPVEVVPSYSPSQYHQQLAVGGVNKTKPVRLTGTVKPESLYPMKDGGTGFIIADAEGEMHAVYRGEPSNLLRDSEAIVAQGQIDTIGVLQATRISPRTDSSAPPK